MSLKDIPIPTENCGVIIPPELYTLAAQPWPLSVANGSDTIKTLYNRASLGLNIYRLSPLGLACYVGDFGDVKERIYKNPALDLSQRESGLCAGYVALTIQGAQRVLEGPPEGLKHAETLAYILQNGAPPNAGNILGHTALHHAVLNIARPDLLRIILENDGDPNAADAFGAVPITYAFTANAVECVEILMQFGARLDIADAGGVTPSDVVLKCGDEVKAAVDKWLRIRSVEGVDVVKNVKRCGATSCITKESDQSATMFLCTRCRSTYYCSVPCQKSHWKTHKPRCHPPTADISLTVKPHFTPGLITKLEAADLAAQALPANVFSKGPRSGSDDSDIQVAEGMFLKIHITGGKNNDPILLCDRRHRFICEVKRADGPHAYDTIASMIRKRGNDSESGDGARHGYFASNLKTKDELVIKMRQMITTQCW